MSRRANRLGSLHFIFEIGRCPRCMRESFIAAFLSWLAYGLYVVLCVRFFNSGPYYAVMVLPLCLSVLWLVHIIAYAVRFTKREAQFYSVDSTGPSRRTEWSNRRAAMKAFMRVAGGIALATSLPVGARTAVTDAPSQSKPNNKAIGRQYAMNCYSGQCAGNTFCCEWGNNSWCCENGTSCDPSTYGCV